MTAVVSEETAFQLILKLFQEHEKGITFRLELGLVHDLVKARSLKDVQEHHGILSTAVKNHFQSEETIVYKAYLRLMPGNLAEKTIQNLELQHQQLMERLSGLEGLLADLQSLNLYDEKLRELEKDMGTHAQLEFEQVYLVVRNNPALKKVIVELALRAGLITSPR